MTAIQFPTSRLVPGEEDQTERSMHAIVAAAHDFTHAILDARSVSRCIQLRERITAVMAVLAVVEREAFDKADRLSEGKNP